MSSTDNIEQIFADVSDLSGTDDVKAKFILSQRYAFGLATEEWQALLRRLPAPLRQEVGTQMSQGAASSFQELPSFSQRFRQLLVQSHITRPDEDAIYTIENRLTSRMIVCETPAAALDLYEDACLIPGKTTCGHLNTQHNVRVNGPLYPRPTEGPASLLIASDADGCPCIIKMLTDRPRAANYAELGGTEAAVWRSINDRLSAGQEQCPIVPAKVLDLTLRPEHARVTGWGAQRYAALQMPQYCGSVVSTLHIPAAGLVRGGSRMISALSQVHSLDIVHMDVKGANILVDMNGAWWLSDFGSAVSVGDPITSTSTVFSSENLIGKPARFEHDWYMLAVALVCEVHKKDWRLVLDVRKEYQHVSPKKLQEVIAAIESQDLRSLLESIVQKAAF